MDDLSQSEADALLEMAKCRVDETLYSFGAIRLEMHLKSVNSREDFILDIGRGRIDLLKVKFQTRTKQVIILARVDIAGAPHKNQDGTEIPTPHLHRYREGYHDKWAEPLDPVRFRHPDDQWATYLDFLQFCNVTEPPLVQQGLFQ